jgi:hypothetical protein
MMIEPIQYDSSQSPLGEINLFGLPLRASQVPLLLSYKELHYPIDSLYTK